MRIYIKIIWVLLICFIINSCNKSNKNIESIESTHNAESYTIFLKSKTFNDLKNQLKQDIKFLDKLIKDSEFEIVLTSHFSPSELKKVTKSVEEFSVNYDKNSLQKVFNWYCDNLFFKQQFHKSEETNLTNDFIEYKSEYKYIYPLNGKDTVFENLESEIEFKDLKYFHIGKPIKKDEIGLKKIDSIYTNIKLDIPKTVDEISLNKNQNMIYYDKDTIEINKINGNSIEFKVSKILNKKLLAVQALNPKGIRMSSMAFSSSPIIEIDRTKINILKVLINIYEKILNEKNENLAKNYLKEINQNQIDEKNNFQEFRKNSKKIYENYKELKNKDAINESILYQDLLKIGKKVFTSNHSSIIVDFPDNIYKTFVYVTRTINTINKKQYVKCYKNIHQENPKPINIYSEFNSKNEIKFGLIDKYGNILVKAKFEKLEQLGNYYYMEDNKLLWFNEKQKEIVSLDDEYKFYEGNIKPGYDILQKKVGEKILYGIIKTPDDVIIDFVYNKITKYGNLIVAEEEKNISFYNLDFKKLSVKGITKINQVGDEVSSYLNFPMLFVAENSYYKNALLDSNLKPLTQYKYEFIKPFYNMTNFFIVGARPKNNDSNYIYGVINDKGQEVVPLIFSYIKPDNDNVNLLYYELKDKKESINANEFIKKYSLK